MGKTNTYRYVNAANVYNAGVSAKKSNAVRSGSVTCSSDSGNKTVNTGATVTNFATLHLLKSGTSNDFCDGWGCV